MSLYKVKSSSKKNNYNNYNDDFDNHSINSNNSDNSYKPYNPNKNKELNYKPYNPNNNNLNNSTNLTKNNNINSNLSNSDKQNKDNINNNNNNNNNNKNNNSQNSHWKNIVLKNIDKPIVNNLKKEEKKEQKTLSYNEYYDYCWNYDERFSLFHGTEVLDISLDFADLIYEYRLPLFDNASNGNNKYVFDFLLKNSHEGLNIIKETDNFNNELKKEYTQEFLEEEEYNNYHKDD